MFTLLLILSLMGCSRVKFAYNQLDWLIPYYTKDYLELSDSQRSYLDEAVNDLLYWHCGNHLGAYAKLMRETNQNFQRLDMDDEKLRLLIAAIDNYWKEIKRQASPAIAKLFATSSRQQIDEMFSRLQEMNEEWLEEYNAQTRGAWRKKRELEMIDELERWFGPLHAGQQEAVSNWSRQLLPLGKMYLEARQQWQRRLHELLLHRTDPAVFAAGLERLFVDPEELYSSDYQQRLETNHQFTINMVAEIGRLLDENQKRHLDKTIRNIADDLDELACRGESKPQVRASTSTGFPLIGY